MSPGSLTRATPTFQDWTTPTLISHPWPAHQHSKCSLKIPASGSILWMNYKGLYSSCVNISGKDSDLGKTGRKSTNQVHHFVSYKVWFCLEIINLWIRDLLSSTWFLWVVKWTGKRSTKWWFVKHFETFALKCQGPINFEQSQYVENLYLLSNLRRSVHTLECLAVCGTTLDSWSCSWLMFAVSLSLGNMRSFREMFVGE